MIDLEEVLKVRELNRATYEVGNTVYVANRTDPYGMWHRTTTGAGGIPASMKGEFTSLIEAEKRLNDLRKESQLNAANG